MTLLCRRRRSCNLRQPTPHPPFSPHFSPSSTLFLNGVSSFKAQARCNPQLFYSPLNVERDRRRGAKPPPPPPPPVHYTPAPQRRVITGRVKPRPHYPLSLSLAFSSYVRKVVGRWAVGERRGWRTCMWVHRSAPTCKRRAPPNYRRRRERASGFFNLNYLNSAIYRRARLAAKPLSSRQQPPPPLPRPSAPAPFLLI